MNKFFLISAFLITASFAQAQTQPQYLRDSTLTDTIPGIVVYTDSIVRMVATGRTGEYRYENVLSTIVVDALCVKQYRWLVKASNGQLDPFDTTQRFLFLSGGAIDPKRILLFKANTK